MEVLPSRPRCGIVPDYLLRRIAQAEPDLARALEFALRDGEAARGRREMLATRWPDGHAPLQGRLVAPPVRRADTPPEALPELPERAPLPDDAAPDRQVHDAEHGTVLPGRLVRTETGEGPWETAVEQAFHGLGATWELLARVYGWDSLDGQGMPLVATVHYARNYANAFWDGRQMVFGDGDRVYFNPFTASVDVIAHELAHGMTQFTAGLTYVGQSGALNESASDVWGAMVRQRVRDETVEEADWLIGADLFTDRVQGVALRSMADPGTAYDDPVLGRDPQPAHMDDYVVLPHDADHDNGGVHINSGIPNHAFYLVASALGGRAWERAGLIWYRTLTGGSLAHEADFAAFAEATLATAAAEYGEHAEETAAVRAAWTAVGVLKDDPTPRA